MLLLRLRRNNVPERLDQDCILSMAQPNTAEDGRAGPPDTAEDERAAPPDTAEDDCILSMAQPDTAEDGRAGPPDTADGRAGPPDTAEDDRILSMAQPDTAEDGRAGPPDMAEDERAAPLDTAEDDRILSMAQPDTAEDGRAGPPDTADGRAGPPDGKMGYIILTDTGLQLQTISNLIRTCPIRCNGNYVNTFKIKGANAIINTERYIIQYEFVFECLKLTIKQPNKKDLLITIVYRPPCSSDFHSHFEEMLSTICRQHRKIIIAV
ncbi:unnamed protein product, partial [Arctogadus glacialis]